MSVFESAKLKNVAIEDILFMFDYDLTLAMKNDPTDTDKAPLLAPHYDGLSNLATRGARLVIITARGEKSVLGYLGEHETTFGRLPNITLASNSGHLIHDLDYPRPATPDIIDIPDCLRSLLLQRKDMIHKIIKTLKEEFPDITADARELCGAVVYQFEGSRGNANPRIEKFQKRAEELKTQLSGAGDITFAQKEWLREGRTMGYIDMIPAGLSKGLTAPIIYNRYKDRANGTPFVIVAGDSGADYEMMTALEAMKDENGQPVVPAERRLFLSVGKGLVACDDAHEKRTGQRLLDQAFTGNGKEPVEQFHDFLATIGDGDMRRTTLDTRTGRAAPRRNLTLD